MIMRLSLDVPHMHSSSSTVTAYVSKGSQSFRNLCYINILTGGIVKLSHFVNEETS